MKPEVTAVEEYRVNMDIDPSIWRKFKAITSYKGAYLKAELNRLLAEYVRDNSGIFKEE